MKFLITTIAALVLTFNIQYSQNYQIIRHFKGNGVDGSHPQASLLLVDSSFYSMTHWGGTADMGCVYKINPDGSGFQLLHSFNNNSTGSYPLYPLLKIDTLLYGITQGNTFFRMEKSGKNLTNIKIGRPDSVDGYIYGGVLYDGNSIYGTETYSGININTNGSVIKYNLNGSGYKVLKTYYKDSIDGYYPGSLCLEDSHLYGLAWQNGYSNGNLLFKIDTNGTNYKIIHTFDGGVDNGGYIASPIIIYNSIIYGIANRGGASDSGIVYKINTDGSGFRILHSFKGDSSDGYFSWGKLTPYGKYLYGITQRGGKYGKGDIFKISTDGSEYSIIRSFGDVPDDGKLPTGDMTLVGNTLYGTTWGGGKWDKGIIFKITELNFWDSCDVSSFNYPYFLSSDGLKLNGKARVTDSTINIVQAQSQLAGSVFYKTPVVVNNGFRTSFSFRFSDGYNDFIDGSAPGADGLVFVIQAENSGALGGNGGELGYSGIPNSLAIEFDTYNNTDFNDPDGNHLAVFSNGIKPNSCTHKSSAELAKTSNILTFKADSTVYYGKIEYNNQLKTLKVWLDKSGDFSEPVLTVDSIDLSELLDLIDNKEAYVGLTSATGTSYQNTDLLSWSFCPFQEQGISPVEDEDVNELYNDITVFPNPGTDIIELRNYNEFANIEILNYMGIVVYRGNGSNKIDVSGLPHGLYFIRVGDRIIKFIKN